MKKTSPFEWNDKADEAFQDLKRMLSTASILAALTDMEPLLLYIAATSRAVSTVLVVERPEKGKIQAAQHPVYHLREVLTISKRNYPHYQKMKAIERMEVPTRLLDVQKFTGCLASISRFISRLGEKALPLYQLMKKTTHFEWNDPTDNAFL